VLVALPCAVVLRRFQLVAGGERAGASELSGSVYEIALVILSAYMAYLVAEARRPRGLPRAAALPTGATSGRRSACGALQQCA